MSDFKQNSKCIDFIREIFLSCMKCAIKMCDTGQFAHHRYLNYFYKEILSCEFCKFAETLNSCPSYLRFKDEICHFDSCILGTIYFYLLTLANKINLDELYDNNSCYLENFISLYTDKNLICKKFSHSKCNGHNISSLSRQEIKALF